METTRKLALVTGASAGIGFELARVFAKNDYDLLIVSSTDRIIERARFLRQYEVQVTEVVADLSTQEGVDLLWQRWSRLERPIDVAVLNAGVGVGGVFVNTKFEEELNLMNLSMVYTVALAKKVLQEMVMKNDGKILFVSSIAAEMPGPYYSVYAASKAFVQSFAEALRYEMEDLKKNITITCLQPGPTDTEFFVRADMENTKAGEAKKDDPAKVAQEGFDALMKGKDHIVAGSVMNKLKAVAGKLLPETQGAAAQGKNAKPKDLDT